MSRRHLPQDLFANGRHALWDVGLYAYSRCCSPDRHEQMLGTRYQHRVWNHTVRSYRLFSHFVRSYQWFRRPNIQNALRNARAFCPFYLITLEMGEYDQTFIFWPFSSQAFGAVAKKAHQKGCVTLPASSWYGTQIHLRLEMSTS